MIQLWGAVENAVATAPQRAGAGVDRNIVATRANASRVVAPCVTAWVFMRFELLTERTNCASPAFAVLRTGAGRPGYDEGNVSLRVTITLRR